MPTFSNRRKASQQKKKSRPFGTLTIDTKCASKGRTFPYESRIPELNFVSYEESKQRKAAHSRDPSLKETLDTSLPIRPGPKQSVPEPVAHEHLVVRDGQRQSAARSLRAIISADDNSTPPLLHKRIKGLRPSPLDLNPDVSPSDQAITIGLALSPNSSRTPPTAHRPAENDERQRYGQDVVTPIIVITPAKDQFSPDLLHASTYRPASSVYSRYTNCMPTRADSGKAPPVPPLPSCADLKSQWSPSTTIARASAATIFEESSPSETTIGTSDVTMSIRQSKRTTAGLPTPRRSKGWWNVLSPFSAKSASTFFWRSPVAQPAEISDQMPILGAAGLMGVSNPHARAILPDRDSCGDELRSAPIAAARRDSSEDIKLPKRSNTASGALETNSSSVNIYRIPSTGEAAAYFDSDRHFPSLCGISGQMNRAVGDDLAGWSPSQSVYIPGRTSISEEKAGEALGGELSSKVDAGQEQAGEIVHWSPAARQDSDSEHVRTFVASPEPAERSVPIGATIFSTPTEDELKSAGLPRAQPTRGFTQTTSDSIWSPLSASPVVEDAHLGRIVGPQSSFGELREVDLVPTPPQHSLGVAPLGAATMAHSEDNSRSLAWKLQQRPPRPPHVRQDSRGLGISDGERDLFPPPQSLREKPLLGVDRFGQLMVKSEDDGKPTQPWFRRFFWLIAGGCVGGLLLLITLLVIFIPLRHSDVPVQASWVNLTGFPALTVGISTVIQHDNTNSMDSCTSQSIWSCAMPGQQNGSLPNFRFEIRFRNGTLPSNETAPASSNNTSTKRWQDSSRLHKFIRRDFWSDYIYTPSPSPPSRSDQEFLGQTTDNITAPYDGEESPFYISFLDPTALPVSSSSKLHKRDGQYTYPYPSDTDEPTTNTSIGAANDIPSPAVDSNGNPLLPQLYPFPSAQPLRLYNRNQESEHYGFYTYFDRSIYISQASTNGTDGNNNNTTTIPNAELQNASAVCTFSQTRFHVQIWTRRGVVGPLQTSFGHGGVAAGNSSGNEMEKPGSFVYPVTITLDRHGGKAGEKGVYCYGLDGEERRVDSGLKWWVDEDRSVGGTLVSAANVPGATVTKRSEVAGGIDGGTGGCGCQWGN